METKIIQDLTKFIKSSIKLDYDDELVVDSLEKKYSVSISDFEGHFRAEVLTEPYKEMLEKFDEYAPLLLKKFKPKPDYNSWSDPNYSEIFSIFGFAKIFEKNKEFHDLSLAFYYIMNSLSGNIDPGECNRILEYLAPIGKLHLIQIHCKDALTYLWENDSDYFYDRLEEHINACKDKYPERIEVFKKTKLYKSWLEDREES